MARPSKYSEALALDICEQIAGGKSLRTICKQDGMPDMATVMRWLADDLKAGFREQYARARDAQADLYAEETIEIADEEVTMIKKSKHGGDPESDEEIEVVFDAAAVARNRLRVDARKWYASKLAPKKYGEKIEHEHGGNGAPIAHKIEMVIVDPKN